MGNELVLSQSSVVTRSLEDLARFAGFSHAKRIDELFSRAIQNVENKMMDGQIMAEDPTLVLDSFKALHKAQLDILEAKRKVAETMVRAQAFRSAPYSEEDDSLPDNLQAVETDAVDVSGAIASSASPSEPGLFGSLLK